MNKEKIDLLKNALDVYFKIRKTHISGLKKAKIRDLTDDEKRDLVARLGLDSKQKIILATNMKTIFTNISFAIADNKLSIDKAIEAFESKTTDLLETKRDPNDNMNLTALQASAPVDYQKLKNDIEKVIETIRKKIESGKASEISDSSLDHAMIYMSQPEVINSFKGTPYYHKIRHEYYKRQLADDSSEDDSGSDHSQNDPADAPGSASAGSATTDPPLTPAKPTSQVSKDEDLTDANALKGRKQAWNPPSHVDPNAGTDNAPDPNAGNAPPNNAVAEAVTSGNDKFTKHFNGDKVMDPIHNPSTKTAVSFGSIKNPSSYVSGFLKHDMNAHRKVTLSTKSFASLPIKF